jgi:hypothetical protein
MAGKDLIGPAVTAKAAFVPAVLGDYITRTSGLAYGYRHLVPKIRDFESNGMDRGTNNFGNC